MLPIYYIIKIPYWLLWILHKHTGKTIPLAVYCAEPLDYAVLEPVLSHLPGLTLIAKNKKTANWLYEKKIPFKRWPVFPEAVIMCRHAAHYFPLKGITKIGFRHGAYHFKAFAGIQYYNLFNVYFMTSREEVREAQAKGITTARALGFPKLDPAFDGTWTKEKLASFRQCLSLDPKKKTLLFTATWDKKGMSAMRLWINFISHLTGAYNVMVTVHPWMSKKYRSRLEHRKGIRFIHSPETLPYLMTADAVIGDISSILAEACALDKPMVTFRIPGSRRTLPEITELLDRISVRIENSTQLEEAIEECIRNPKALRKERKEAARLMFDRLDGKAGLRAAEIIRKILATSDGGRQIAKT
jgi:hypothetical protein